MSGTAYNAGTYSVVPGQLTNIGTMTNPVYVPTGAANVGTGSLTNLALLSSTSTIYAGVYAVVCTGSGAFTIAGDKLGSSTIFTTTRTVAAGTMANPTITGLNIKFTLKNDGGGGSGTEFAFGDGFLLYVTEQGQNSTTTAQQLTGASVTVQQFQTSTSSPLYWGAAINAMFVYCGANPGVVGIIPPGFYDCDDLAAGGAQLIVQSNMTISAYGAFIGCSKSTSAQYGFVGHATPAASAAANVTILGGTWGGLGHNGVYSTDDTLEPYDGTRTGKVFSLFVDQLTMRDVTVRGFASLIVSGMVSVGGLAYALYGNNLFLDNCGFWNSDQNMGSGGIRVLSGQRIRITNTQGQCGDDALQFAPLTNPPPGIVSGSITDAFFIGGNVTSYQARAVICAASSGTSGDYTNAPIYRVGFIGITGTTYSNNGTVCKVENLVSTMPITDVSLSTCKFLVVNPGSNPAVIINSGDVIPGTTPIVPHATSLYAGGVSRVVFSDVTVTGAGNITLLISGVYDSSLPIGGHTTTTTSNLEFSTCKFIPNPTSTATTVVVQQCGGFALRGCEIYATTSHALQLGVAGNPQMVASHGIIDGCRLYTASSSTMGAPSAITIDNADMITVTGWTSFFLGSVPDIANVMGTGQAVSIGGTLSVVTNTYLDNLDMRGLGNSTNTISNQGSNTVIGSNILAQALNMNIITAPSAANIPAYTKFRTPLSGTMTNVWPENATVFEFTNTGTVAAATTITLPTAQRDGELRILAAETGTFNATSTSLIGSVSGLGTSTAVAPKSALRLMWDAAGNHWLTI